MSPGVDASPARGTVNAGTTLSLRFARSPDGETFIDHQLARYPCHVCRVLRFPGDPPGMATVYLQSASGGLYEGDRLRFEMQASEGACAHVTTQASTIVHATRDSDASQEVALRVGPDALLEYLPDPVILFPGARLRSSVRVTVKPGAAAIIGESFLGHDPKGLDRHFSALASDVSVATETGMILAGDRFVVEGRSGRDVRVTKRGSFHAHGSLLCFGFREQHGRILDEVRTALDVLESRYRDIYAGASVLPGEHGVWIRALAMDGASLKRCMQAAWMAARRVATGLAPQARQK